MKKEIIEEVVFDQRENLKLKDTGIKRQVNYKKAIVSKQIVVISGVRRSGKSTLFLHLMENYKNFYYFNFDDERLIDFNVSDFQELMIIFKTHYSSNVVFFDEIQNIEGWERFIRRIFDEGYKIFITGSNAKLLSSELATHLTGRYIKIELFPFSLIEILEYNAVDYKKLTSDNKANLIKYFDKYLTEGGFPEMIKYADNEFLKRIYDDIIHKDIIVRHKIRNSKIFKNLSLYLLTNFTGELSYNSLKTSLNIKSTNTVKEYVAFLEESYLVFELYKFHFSLKKQYTSNKKIYSIDNGIRDIVAFKFSDDKGKYLENFVFVELKRRQKDVFFYKTKNNKEVDFIYYEDNCFNLIQVAYTFADYRTKKREIDSLIEAGKELPKTKSIIITYNEDEIIKTDTIEIQVIPAWKWLLIKS
ncbi:MAG: AAA family ATPase [Bacteroidetes bacterium 4484_249]|nr:MAG: AAA family ATPase [Bacteroidetes bacterium 4484_249]